MFHLIMTIRDWLRERWAGISPETRQIFLLLFVTRIALWLVALISYQLVSPFHPRADAMQRWPYPHSLWLQVWCAWDSGWYLDIARHGYSLQTHPPGALNTNYGFFPLYPLLIRLLSLVVRSDALAGVLISNGCLAIACVYLFKLTRLDHDRETALRAVKYFVLFPTAFVLSAVLTESLFTALAILCLYAARRERWAVAGALGFLVALTRPNGIFLLAPVLWIYLRQKQFHLNRIRFDALFMALIPLGLACLAFYDYYRTGDPLAYAHAQAAGWGHHLTNPLAVLFAGMASGQIDQSISAWFGAAALALLIIRFDKLRMEYWLYAAGIILLPLMAATVLGLPRYLATLFPLAIVLSQSDRRPGVDRAITLIFALLQGCFLLFWTNGYLFMS